ncbi:hypothetical protein FOA43_003557 [Brettanomyces nanus]|uniref:RING-type domain-containing protein n=1 Tax=Eeniella nana TaxID=13502 RepID=A0A875S397_EENNA|nr:uncharacterized protein FOA43_003557 [Brettanomyces nanus]QPG76171.1 hypothetical protein FOA43_003557 [Brettanomyces nanus]
MGSKLRSSQEDLVLKSYGLLDSSTLKDLTFSLEKEFLGKCKASPQKLTGIKIGGKHRSAPLPPINGESSSDPVAGTSSPLDSYVKRINDFKRKLKMLHSKTSHQPKKKISITDTPVHIAQLTSLPTSMGGSQSPSHTPPPHNHSYSSLSASPTPNRRARRKRGSSIEQDCIFCNLPLQSTLSRDSGEKIIELKCGHHTHEQCILLQMQITENFSEDHHTISFPDCPACDPKQKAVPLGPDTSSELSTAVLLNSRTNFVLPDLQLQPKLQPQLHPCQFSPSHIPRRSPKRHVKKHSRGSSITANLSTFSSASAVSPSSPDFSLFGWTSNYTIESLRGKFIKELEQLSELKVIHVCEGNEEVHLSSTLMSSFGNLRLFDKMSLSHDAKEWSQFYCYLFEHILIIVSCKKHLFRLVQITPLMIVETPSRWCVSIRVPKESEPGLFFSSVKPDILEKWISALMNTSCKFTAHLLTSTIKEDEFNEFVNVPTDVPSITAERNIDKPRVNSRFYESALKSLVFRKKPDNMLIILNNDNANANPSFLVSITNILKSLLLVKIDVTLVLCSTDNFTVQSSVISTYHLTDEECFGKDGLLLERIGRYQKQVSSESFNRSQGEEIETVDLVSKRYLQKMTAATLVVISSASLNEYEPPDDSDSVLIEVNSANDVKGGPDVIKLINWEDVMEAICSHCGLEFDDSDFERSSDEENEDDGKDEDIEEEEENVRQEVNDMKDNSDDTESTQKGARWSYILKDIDKALKDAHISMEKYKS